MIPIWTLKVGSVAVAFASTAGFWNYVTGHIHPVKAPLKPKVVQLTEDPALSRANTGWQAGTGMQTVATPPPVIVKKVVVEGGQQQVQTGATLGANWIANKTGQKPVTYTSVS
jgi:hypothetical protein